MRYPLHYLLVKITYQYLKHTCKYTFAKPERHSLSKNEIQIRGIKSTSGYPFLDGSLNSLTHCLHTKLYKWMYIKCYQETRGIMYYDVYVFSVTGRCWGKSAWAETSSMLPSILQFHLLQCYFQPFHQLKIKAAHLRYSNLF